MKAWVLHGINDLRLEDAPLPTPGKGEVLIRVRAAGICSSDISRVYGTGAYHYPIILGHEFAGTTPDGRRVGVFPLLPCHSCESCREGHYETCSGYSYIGSRRDGAFAEYVAAPEWNLLDLPDDVTFEQAALLEPAAVAFHAVGMLRAVKGAKAAVIGNGAIGRLISAWLAHYGAECAEVLGRNDRGAFQKYDVCVEAAGTSEAFARCAELVKQNGEIVLVGNPETDFQIGRELYWQILRRQITVRGSWNSGYPSDWRTVIENAGGLRLDRFISHKYGFTELSAALERIHNKMERYGKVIVTFT